MRRSAFEERKLEFIRGPASGWLQGRAVDSHLSHLRLPTPSAILGRSRPCPSDIARQIVDALKIRLNPVEAAMLSAGKATNSKAHDLFLLGREIQIGASRTAEAFPVVGLRCLGLLYRPS